MPKHTANAWVPRTIEAALSAPPPALQLFPVWLLLGPRQVGKTSVLVRCAGSDRQYVNLDDLAVRARANADPALFARDLRPPLLIDEIQYAPALLSAVKVLADAKPGPGAVWITGSQSFEVMRGVQETLAGRVALLELQGLADEERQPRPATPDDVFASVLRSRFPALHRVDDVDARELYLDGYVRTYLERDVRELLGVQKRREFERFVRLCALRTGQLVNYDDLGRDAGVSATTAKEWLAVLADSFLVMLVPPWHANASKRLVKSHKLYFLDAGLAAWLSGWRTLDQVRYGPQAGALLETHVLAQIVAALRHRAREARVHFWRDRDGREVDFLVETRSGTLPIEVKVGTPSGLAPLARIREPSWRDGLVVSLLQRPGETAACTADWTAISLADLPYWLLGTTASTEGNGA